MKILGIGLDIVDNRRVKSLIKNKNFINRAFSKNEIRYSKKTINKTSYFSKRFAAKESFVKALGTGFRKNVNLKDIDQVICATFSGDYVYPALACKISQKLNLKQPGCFDIMANCTGFQTALNIAFNNLKNSKNITSLKLEIVKCFSIYLLSYSFPLRESL